MERLVIHLSLGQKAALRVLAKVERRTVPGMAEWLLVEALKGLGLYSDDQEETEKQSALRQALAALGSGGEEAGGA